MVIFRYLHYRYFASVATCGDVATTCPPLNFYFSLLEILRNFGISDILARVPGLASSGARFCYVIFQISRDQIPAAYENEKNLPRLTPSLTSIGRIRTL